MKPILVGTGLTIGYQARRQPTNIVAEGLELHLYAGQLVCLLGPNGAGKSTLMRTLAGMQTPLAGHIWLDEQDVAQLPPAELAQKLSVVLTERVDVGLLSAYDLVALGRYPYTNWRGQLTAVDHAIIQRAISDVGAKPLASRPVSQLSDGERQKIMIARALAQEPRLMMLDEPTAFLDLPRRVEVMHILRKLAHERNRAVLLSTHDLDLALRSADMIWLMANGRLHQGAPEDLVLNGVFAQAFASEGVHFDPMTGSFALAQTAKGVIGLVGEAGLPLTYTQRALERLGYEVHIGNERTPVVVRYANGRWQLKTMAPTPSFYDSIAELMQAIEP